MVFVPGHLEGRKPSVIFLLRFFPYVMYNGALKKKELPLVFVQNPFDSFAKTKRMNVDILTIYHTL